MLPKQSTTRINHQIRANEVRVIGANGENYGVISLTEALKHAEEAGLDLIEISPSAVPPVCKIMDHGKYLYDQKKKQREIKSKVHITEIKTIQVKIGTGENDLAIKAKQASEWLAEGHRVKVELFLPGRSKYLDPKFLETRLERLLSHLTTPYKIAEAPKKGPKGIATIVEKA